MEGLEENMEDVDLEEQPLPQSPPPSPPPLRNKSPRKPGDGRRVLATPARALSLVVLVVGVLFSVHLLVHDLRTFALLAAEWLCIFFVMSCVAACEGGARDDDAGAHGSRGLGTVADVALWSFAMALTVTMTFWVAAGLPLPAVAFLYLLSLLAISACFAVLLRA
ncbi:hypothetical protein BAE44_0014236 [Dichanthelium oligosanthes]|uniref:Uncharacterized protein n=1 Tax=Dichanthelium oligosanthes TaxID=888268 RepID=A0A1E5VI11_9POAL|nr:hypothetical protein BAE44_0014236 [Dichanthelium oligosanthes]